ncbi:MAG: YidC/Oxa1 family insertase periplasmic-domain containing protein [Planctomycetales bacterium]|nr:YidC/Oxa1 family insertase periplasmic-domain containing protein [Planctomycetales bacterium]
MDRRAITFILLSSVVLLSWIALEPILNPPQAPPNRLAQENGDGDPSGTDEGSEGDSTSTDGEVTEPSSGDGTGDNAGPETPEEPPFVAAPELVGLGSLSSDSPYRMLVTLDSRGGSVRRIELSDRKPDGQFRFKHVDDRAGYLGNLEVETELTSSGAIVRFVGSGTPAAQAAASDGTVGIRPGDLIVELAGEPVLDAGDYFAKLGRTKPGDKLEIKVQRDGSPLTLTAELLARPMEVIQPFPQETSDPDLWNPPSFTTVVGGIVNGLFTAPTVDLTTADWAVGEPGDASDAPADEDLVTFHYVLTDKELAGTRLQGPITLIKRFRIARRAQVSEPTRLPEFDRSYHLEMQFEIRNQTTEVQRLAVQFGGPTGLPEEGWWYLNKIHGRSTAIFYTAGSRDVVGSSRGLGFRFLGGPEIVANALQEDGSRLEIFPQTYDTDDRTVEFAAVDTQYFNVAMIPEVAEGQPPFTCFSGSVDVTQDPSDIDRKQRRRTDVSFRLQTMPLEVEPYDAAAGGDGQTYDFTIFTGPKFPELLEQYNLNEVVSYGWFALFSKPLVWTLHFFYMIVGNYGIAIIMLTVVVRAAMIPVSRRAAMNAQMMQHLQPEMKKIAELYKNDMEKRAKAQQELFRKYNYNPMGGCLLMFIQLPIFLGLYRGLSVDVELRDQSLLPGLSWCSNLAGPDRLFEWGNWAPFLTSETGWLGPYFNVLPIITIVLFLIQQKMFMPPAVDEQQKATQKMMTFMMVFMGLMFFKVPSGLCIYFITSSLWGIVERKVLPKPSIDGRIASIETTEVDADEAARDKSAGQARIEEERRRRQKRRDPKKK